MSRRCDSPGCEHPARLYPCGLRCDPHSPAAVAGHTVPVPDPARTAAALRAAHGLLAVGTLDSTSSLNDERAIASGRRRASPAAYRLARAAEDERRSQP